MKNGLRNIGPCLLLLMLMLPATSCEDFIVIPPPPTQLVQDVVFEEDNTALAAMASVYYKVADDGFIYGITAAEGLYSDELVSFTSLTDPSPLPEFYFNNVTPINGMVLSNWSTFYKIIYECNRMLEGLNASTGLTFSLKQQLTGEAMFIRAFCYFYLVNLYGDVPLITTTDYRVNAKVARTAIDKVYESIINDLSAAKELLSDNYPSAGRVRVNKGASIAMLARVYLYTENYVSAEAEATELINKTSQYQLLNDLNSVFLNSSSEAIWQLLPKGGIQQYTTEGFMFILVAAPPTRWTLRNDFPSAFEPGDLRKKAWIDSLVSTSGLTKWYYPFKYKENHINAAGAESSMALRVAEQYLIRAEARANLDKLIGANSATSDINIIRNRAGLPNTTALSAAEVLAAIELERRLEFFTEWGHRFFDLKRTGRIDAVLTPVKPNWNTTDALLPIPQNEMLLNPNLKPQNPGY